MTGTDTFPAFALLLALFATACAASPAITAASATPVPCNAELVGAANYSDDLADRREAQMQVMRFASQQAMEAYQSETRRLRMEAGRLNELLVDLAKRHGAPPDLTYSPVADPTPDGAAARIAAADACAAKAFK